MQYLVFEHISKAFGEKVLFEDLNLTISKGQKIALVAKNGSGKTTLLKILAQEEAPEGERAHVEIAKNIRCAYLKQEPEFQEDWSVLEVALDSENAKIRAVKQYEEALLTDDNALVQERLEAMDSLNAWDIESKVKETLYKLKITRLDQKIKELSGGQKKRLALAKIIIDEPDFVILDEPTNHLDLDMIEWLEQYLEGTKMTIFMVTHDRYFLERVCNEIVELDNKRLYHYRGTYSDFLEKKALRMDNEQVVHDKTVKLYKKELNWIRKQPKARGTKAKSRVDKFDVIKSEALNKIDDSTLELNIEPARLGSKILEAHAITKVYDELKIVESFSYKFKKGERVGIAGPNGVGKTTFVKLLTKEIRVDGGKVVIGDTVVFGHYAQTGLDTSQDRRVIDVVRQYGDYIPLAKGRKLSAEALLERFLFPRPQQQVYISQLSGGEKRRLHLLTVLIANPNFLILDEPTNDLDIVSLNILEDYLLQFPGCILIVSHDRYFMDKIVDHMFVLEGQGKIKDFPGNYTQYRDQYDLPKVSTKKVKEAVKAESVHTEPSEVKRKLSYKEKMQFQNAEKLISQLEKRKKEIMEAFNDTSLSGEQIEKLSIELGEVGNQLEEQEMIWLELSEFM